MKRIIRFSSMILAVIMLLSIQLPIVSAAPKISKKNKPSLSLFSKSYTTITLKWKKFSDADGYIIYRKTSKNASWKKIKTTTASSFTNKSLKLNKKYWYRIKAYDKKGSRKVYSPYSSTKYMSPKLQLPTLSAASATTSSIKLSVKKPKGATGVMIYRKTSSNGSWKKIKTTTLTSYTNTSLSANKTYYYRAKAYKKISGKYYYSAYTKQIKKKTAEVPVLNHTISGIKLKEKSVIKGLNLGGKKVKMAIVGEPPYTTNTHKRTVAAFEQAYNCEIVISTLNFGKYNQQVAQAYASGAPYDICYAHGSMFPECAIDGIYNNLNDYISAEDLMDKSKPLSGGIDASKSSNFVYNDGIYGACGFQSVSPYLIYYNKVLMAEKGYNGNNDPRNLHEKGEWTWDKILEMGKRVTDVNADKYFLSNSFSGRGLNLAYGAPIVIRSNGKYKQNVDSLAYTSGLRMMQKLFFGAERIAEPRDATHAYNSYATMLNGNSYMFIEESSKYSSLSKDVQLSSAAFERSKDNIGIVAVPLGETNLNNAYPTGWIVAVCSPKGSDPRIAVAWSLFRSSFVDPITDPTALSEKDQTYANNLIKGNICHEVGNFASSSTNTLSLTEGSVVPKVVAGQDVNTQVNNVKYKMTECINQTMGY